MQKLLDKAGRGEQLTRDDALELLHIETASKDYYHLLAIANEEARTCYGNQGSVLAQIGIEASPCPGNCKFCSLADDIFPKENSFLLPVETSERIAKTLVKQGADELFLMTTANYTNDEFLSYAARIKKCLPEKMRFVANVGDYDKEFARELKKVGFTGVYHVCRLREGIDNDLSVAERERTIEAAIAAGLERYYCVEPIGPEHTYEEMVEEMVRARNIEADVAAAMKRTAVPGTELYKYGEISSAELAKIVAVTELFVKPKRAMGVHEPDILSLMAGANQIYAEVNVNPRDVCLTTELSRGASMEKANNILRAANWIR